MLAFSGHGSSAIQLLSAQLMSPGNRDSHCQKKFKTFCKNRHSQTGTIRHMAKPYRHQFTEPGQNRYYQDELKYLMFQTQLIRPLLSAAIYFFLCLTNERRHKTMICRILLLQGIVNIYHPFSK